MTKLTILAGAFTVGVGFGLQNSLTTSFPVVQSRRENSAISGVGHKRSPLLADEGPVIGSATSMTVDVDPIRPSILMRQKEGNRLF